MHYFNTLQIALETETVDSYHVGHSVPIYGLFGQKKLGTITTIFTYKNMVGSRTIIITVAKANAFDAELEKVKKELKEFFCPETNIAKEDPTDRVTETPIKEKTIL